AQGSKSGKEVTAEGEGFGPLLLPSQFRGGLLKAGGEWTEPDSQEKAQGRKFFKPPDPGLVWARMAEGPSRKGLIGHLASHGEIAARGGEGPVTIHGPLGPEATCRGLGPAGRRRRKEEASNGGDVRWCGRKERFCAEDERAGQGARRVRI